MRGDEGGWRWGWRWRCGEEVEERGEEGNCRREVTGDEGGCSFEVIGEVGGCRREITGDEGGCILSPAGDSGGCNRDRAGFCICIDFGGGGGGDSSTVGTGETDGGLILVTGAWVRAWSLNRAGEDNIPEPCTSSGSRPSPFAFMSPTAFGSAFACVLGLAPVPSLRRGKG